ncbi:hypothetical protein BDB00DRAFT_787047 [Zychaea mexicana]|uniref:uncharacterized protein n=1 Tax=Zychaea mexicana TaxID=64656 RepID=UPI0022FE1632|nr:uncharacterized protein BDB00DRAFT_787047 [Zychaea mexicana]KAI9494704.1 hypothetical protein BDB00DRAFT_787047 [Zychaea mexicana]
MVFGRSSILSLATVALLISKAQADLSLLVGSHEGSGLYLNTDLRVPHGCKNSDGSLTLGVTVEIPSEILAVQAEYIPDYNLTITKQQLTEPQALSEGGREVSSRTASIQWMSADPVPDGAFMDYKMRIYIPKIGDDETHTHYFKTTQHCEGGVNDVYDQIPGSENYDESSGRNAPFIEIGGEVDSTPWIESKENRNTNGASSSQKVAMAATALVAGLAAFNLA